MSVARGAADQPAELETQQVSSVLHVLKRGLGGETAVSFSSPLLLLLLWEAAARTGMLNVMFFPAPSSIFGAFTELLASGELPQDVKATVGRVLVGLVMGIVPGMALGVVMGLSRFTRAILKPMVDALFPIPKIAVLPLIMLIVGLGEMSKYVAVAVGVIFLVLINTMRGVMGVDRIYLEVGQNYGASRLQVYRTIAFPAALPYILTGVQSAVAVGFLLIVAAEFVSARTGVGHLIFSAWETFAVPKMFCGLFVMAILGLVGQALLDAARWLLLPWQRENA